MDPIVLAASTAVVDVMAVDAWQQTRAAVADWWRRARPAQAEMVDLALDQSRAHLLAARQAQDTAAEQAIVAEWQLRLQSLVQENPTLVQGLRRLLDEELVPALSAQKGTTASPVVMKAKASGHGQIYQAGHDLHITEQ
jgi:hypothetical protein